MNFHETKNKLKVQGQLIPSFHEYKTLCVFNQKPERFKMHAKKNIHWNIEWIQIQVLLSCSPPGYVLLIQSENSLPAMMQLKIQSCEKNYMISVLAFVPLF